MGYENWTAKGHRGVVRSVLGDWVLAGDAASVAAGPGALPGAMAPFSQVAWKNNVSGVWSNANNWTGGALPGATNDVLLDTLSVRTVTFSSGTATVHSITADTDNLNITGGTLTVLTTAVFDAALTLSGNGYESLLLDGASASVAGGFSPGDGNVLLGTATVLTVTGPAMLGYSGSFSEIDGGTLSTTGTTSVLDNGGSQSTAFGDGIVWTNNGIVNDAGIIWGGDTNGGTATFVNAAGALFDFTSDDGSILNGYHYGPGDGSSTFSNAGTLEKIGGAGGTSNIYSAFTNTGLIDVVNGTIAFDDGGNFGGTLTGAGQIAFYGNSTLTAGSVFSAGGLLADGSSFVVAAGATVTQSSLTISSNFTVSTGATFNVSAISLQSGTFSIGQNYSLGAGDFTQGGGDIYLNGTTLSVNGANFSFSIYNVNGTVDGPGGLSTAGSTSVVNTYGGGNYYAAGLVLGDGLTWSNTGTVAVSDFIYTDTNYAAGFSIVNQAGGVFDFSNTATYAGNYYVGENASIATTFLNNGLLAETTANYEGIGSAFTNGSTGTISAVAGGEISFDGGGTFAGLLTGAGTLQFNGAGSTLTTGAVFNAATLNADSTNFLLSTGASISSAAVNVLDNFAVSAGSTFNVGALYVDGDLSLSSSASVSITSLSVVGGSLSLGNNLTLGAGDFVQNAGDIYLDGTTLSVNGANFSFSIYNVNGTVDGPGGLSTAGSTSVVNTYGGGNYYAAGLVLGDGLTWSNTGTVAVSDFIYTDTNYTSGFSIVNQTGGVFDFSNTATYVGNYYVAENSSIATTFINNGLVAETTANYEGIGSNFTNSSTGTISAVTGGEISFDGNGTFAGLMTGAGTLQFDATSTTLTSGAVFNAATLNAYSTNFVLSAGARIASAAVNVFDNFAVSAGSTFSVGTLYVGSGDLSLSSGASASITDLSIAGGSLSLGSNLAFGAHDFAQNGGDIYLDGATLSVNGGSFSFSSYNVDGYVDGPGTLATTGSTSVLNAYNGGNYYSDGIVLGNGVTWSNSGTVAVSAFIYSDTNYATGFSIVNQAGGVFDFSNTATYAGNYYVAENAGIATFFINNGLVAETTANYEYIGSSFTNNSTGTLSAAAGGTLSLDGGGSLAGTLIGKGVLVLDSAIALNGFSTATTTTVNAADGALTLTGNSSIAGTSIFYNDSINLGTATLALTATKTFGTTNNYNDVFVDGQGTLSTTGATSVVDYNGYVQMTVGGNATWSNGGTVNDATQIQLGDGSGSGTLINLAGAVFNLTGDDASIGEGTYVNGFGQTEPSGAVIVNAGKFAKDGGTLTSNIYATFDSTGTISTFGTNGIELDNGGTLTGVIADSSHVTLANGAGYGAGFSIGNLVVGGSGTLTNAVTVDATGTLTLGDTTNTGRAEFANSGTYEIDGNGGIVAAGTAADLFANTGLLEKISGTGRGVVSVNVVNTGTILANSGTLALTGTVTGSGALDIGAGDTLEIGAGVATSQSVTFAAASGTLLLDSVSGSHGVITGFTVGNYIDLANTTATSATLTANKLVIYNGTTAVTTLTLTGSHSGDTYSFGSDGHGGTVIGISSTATAWKGTSADWNGTNVWTNGAPSAQSNATVSGSAAYTLSLAAGESAYANNLVLSGTTANYDLNGTLNISNTLSLSAGTLVLGGTVNGGTLAVKGGSVGFYGAYLDNVLFEGALNLIASNESVELSQGTSLTGSAGTGGGTINLTGGGSVLYIDGVTTLNNATINIGSSGGTCTLYSNDFDGNGGVLTLGASVVLTQIGEYAALTDNGGAYDGILNEGTITATAAGGDFVISGSDFENDGTMTLASGDTLDIASASFVNTGKFAASGATLTLGGNSFLNTGSITTTNTLLNISGQYTTAQVLGLFGGGDSLAIGGTLTNTGATLTIGGGSALGTVALTGTIEGGTIVDDGNGLLTQIGNFNSYATLSDVTYQGTLNVTGGLNIEGTFTATGAGGAGSGTINDVGSSTEIVFYDTRTINGASINLGNTGGADLSYISVSDDTGNGATLTLGSNLTITQAGQGASLYYYQANDAIISQGSIAAGVAGGTFTALNGAGGSFTNQGIITVSNGDTFALNGAGTFTNLSGTTLTGGSYTINAGSVLEIANNAFITKDAATITLNGAGAQIQGYNTSSSRQVTLDNALSTIVAGGVLNLLGGRNFNATGNHGVFTDSGVLSLAASNFTAATLTVAGGTLSGYGTVTGLVVDSGSIAASGGGTLQFAGAVSGTGTVSAAAGATVDFTQGGGLTEAISGAGTVKLDGATAYTLAAGAAVSVSTIVVDAGVTLSGTGSITSAVADAGTVAATSGTLAIGGAVTGAGTLSAASGTVLDLAGGGSFSGVINGAGTLQLDGASNFVLLAAGSLSTAAVVVDTPATLDLNAGGSLAGSISGAGTLKLDGGTPYTLAAGTVLGIANLLIDAGAGLSGSGTIGGAVVDNGNLGASAGTLIVDGAVSGSGSLSAAGGAVLDLKGGGTLTSKISGAGTLQLDGASPFILTGGGAVGVGTIAIDAGATLSGAGTLAGGVIDAGTLAATGGLLQVTGNLSGAGALVANSAAVLNLTVGESLSETASGAGTLKLDGGTYALAGVTDSVSAVLLDAGATISGFGTLSGALTDNGTVSVSGGKLALGGALSGTGSLQVAAGAVLDLVAGGTLTQAVGGAGTLELGGAETLGATGPTVAALLVDAGASLSGTGTIGGTVSDAGTVGAVGGTLTLKAAVSGGGTLSAGTGSVLDLKAGGALSETVTGAGTLRLDGTTSYTLAGGTVFNVTTVAVDAGATLSGIGTLSSGVTVTGTLAAAGGTLVIKGSVSGGTGALQAGSGAVLDLQVASALTEAISGAGTLQLDGGVYTHFDSAALSVGTVLVDTGATFDGYGTIGGVVSDSGTIEANGGKLVLSGAVSGSGSLLAATGQILDLTAGGTLSEAIKGSGTLELGGAYTLGATGPTIAAILVDAAGSLSGSGTISGTVTNNGLLSGSGGTLAFLGAVSNAGTVDAALGVTSFKSAVSGTGTLEIGASGTLSLLAGAGAGQTVDFLAATGLLDLTSPLGFLGTIEGFGGSNTIDLINTVENGYSYSGGVLTVTENGSAVAKLDFTGTYTQGEFALNSDNHGGTAITFV